MGQGRPFASANRMTSYPPPRPGAARVLAILVALAVCGGCVATAPTGPTESRGPLHPLVVGWEQHATIDFQVAPRGNGSVVWGYLQTGSPYTFHRIRVLVDGLDGGNQIVAQQVAWVPGTLAWPSRLYFEVPMPPAESYRVSVFSWDRLETDRGRGRWW
jgi:hypothetical protein